MSNRRIIVVINTNINALKKSLKNHGFSLPFAVWKDDNVIYCVDGHTRVKALKELTRYSNGCGTDLESNNQKQEYTQHRSLLLYMIGFWNNMEAMPI